MSRLEGISGLATVPLMSTEPGWYPDQRAAGQLRYFDGDAWTEHTMPTPPAGAEPTVPLAFRPSGPQTSPQQAHEPARDTRVLPTGPEVGPLGATQPWHTRWWIVGGVALVVGLLVGTAVTGGSDLKQAATPSQPSATVTITATPSTDPPPSAESTPYSGPSGNSAAAFAMPDEIGKYLQDAQDDLQSISGKTFFYTGSSDASGQGRAQILDSGWKVCSQSVAPGTQVSVDDRSISFGAVKLDEDCP